MTVIELLDGLILAMTDYIDDYEYDVKHPKSRIDKYEKNIRANELRQWRKILREIREEQS